MVPAFGSKTGEPPILSESVEKVRSAEAPESRRYP